MNAVAHNLLNLRVQLADELRASTFITFVLRCGATLSRRLVLYSSTLHTTHKNIS